MPTWWQAVTPTSSMPDAHRLERRGRHAVEERLDAAQEVEVVVEQLGASPAVGKPSVNSSVPMRVSTRSGVMILAGIGVLKPSGFTRSLTGVPPPAEPDATPTSRSAFGSPHAAHVQ